MTRTAGRAVLWLVAISLGTAAGWGSTAGFLAVVYASLPAFLSVLSLR
jgi:hypothetical protein